MENGRVDLGGYFDGMEKEFEKRGVIPIIYPVWMNTHFWEKSHAYAVKLAPGQPPYEGDYGKGIRLYSDGALCGFGGREPEFEAGEPPRGFQYDRPANSCKVCKSMSVEYEQLAREFRGTHEADYDLGGR